MNKQTVNRAGSLGIGGAVAALILFAVKINFPEAYAMMGDVEKQAVTVIVLGATQVIWSKVGK